MNPTTMRPFAVAATIWIIGAAASSVWAQTAPPVASPAAAQVVTVRAADYFYEPAQLIVRPGPLTIEFTNDGPRRHTLNVRDAGDTTDLVKSPRLVAGDTASVSFNVPSDGTFAIYCSEPGHLDQGHSGALIASAAGTANLQPSQPPQSALSTGRIQGRRDLSPTLIALWLHVPFITAWIGFVMFDVFALTVPGLTLGQRARMVAWSRPFAVLAIIVIMGTGIWQTIDNPFQEIKSFSDLDNLKVTTTYGMALFWKHGFVLATFGLTILARFLLAPRLVRVGGEGDGHERRMYQALTWTSAANLTACLFTLLVATRMIWELH